MGPFKLDDEDVVVIDGLRWIPGTVLEDGVALRPFEGGPAKAHRWHDLVMLWADQRMRIQPKPCKGLSQNLIDDIRLDISIFSEDQQKEASRRRKYIRLLEFAIELRDRRRFVLFRPVRRRKQPRIVLKAKDLDPWCKRWAKHIEANGVSDAPCGGSLLEWYRRFTLSGRCLSALIPQSHRQGNRERRLWPPAIEIMEKFARRQWLQPERPHASKIFGHVRDRIRTVAREYGIPEHEIEAKVPKIGAFYKIINNIGSLEREIHRNDPKEAKHKHRIKGKGPDYKWIGETLQIDSTELPIVVRDPKTGLVFKQVTLTVAIDLATRAIVGWYVGLEKGFATIQEALRMTMMPKTWFSRLEGINNEYTASVKPSVVTTDQGGDFRSNDLVITCGQLNIRLKHTPAGAPYLKGVVERQFRESKAAMFAGMPGSLFKNGERFTDYHAAEHAEMTMEQVNWIVCKFVADIWMQKWSDAIEDSPAEKWRKLSALKHPEMAPSIDHLIPLVSKVVEKVTIQHTGLEWMNLFYGHSSPEVQDLMNREGPGARNYRMRIDAMDVGRAYLLVDGEWLVLAASDPDARGRTLHDHLVIRAEARSRKTRHERLHQPDLDAASRRIYAAAEARNNRKVEKDLSSRKARVLVEKIDNLADEKRKYIESVDPEATNIPFDEVEYVYDDELETEYGQKPQARPERPKAPATRFPGRQQRKPATTNAAAARMPPEVPVVAASPNSTVIPFAAPASTGSIRIADNEMPSAVADSAADAIPRRRRSFRFASFS